MNAPPVRPFPLQAGNPANHGYAPCVRCGTQRPLHHLLSDEGEKTGTPLFRCLNAAWCSEQAKATGRLETP